jgi:hypothetical protein
MASIFTTCEEGVFKYTPPDATAAGAGCTQNNINIIEIKDETGITMAPITGFRLELASNHQFLHTLSNFIYVFSFGDRVGELTISGVVVTGCSASNDAGSAPNATDSSMAKLYDRYLKKRLAANLTPSLITIGNSPVSLLGFLTGMSMEIPNPALPIAQWSFRYNVIINARTTVPGVGR